MVTWAECVGEQGQKATWAHYNEKRSDFYDADNAPGTWGSRISYDHNSDLTMKVSDSEVIWSMDGFKDEGPEKKKWTEFRFPINTIEKDWFQCFHIFYEFSIFCTFKHHREFRFPFNITEREWFPLFVVAGCDDYDRSVVEIVESKIGN